MCGLIKIQLTQINVAVNNLRCISFTKKFSFLCRAQFSRDKNEYEP